MEGALAALGLILGLSDMGLNYCATGCLAQSAQTSRLSFSGGSVIFQEDGIAEELMLRYELGTAYGPFQPAIGVSATSQGDIWAGVGAVWSTPILRDRGYVQFHLMPGLHAQGDGPDLGNTVLFRSGVEIGFETRNNWRWGLSYDHRSNAERSDLNPGLETVQLRLSIPLD